MDCIFIPLSSLEVISPLLSTPLILPTHLQSAVEKRQRSYLTGRACAQFLYAKYQLEWDGLPMYADTHPLKGAPQWPQGFVGSISHSNDLAVACLFSKQKVHSVGIDTEHIMNQERALQLRSHILHPLETWVKTPLELSLVFSFKESIYKALNPLLKRFIGFQEVIVYEPTPKLIPETVPQQTPLANQCSLSWRAESTLSKDLKAYFGKHLPPFTGRAQWWQKPDHTGFVFTTYRF